MSNGAIYSHETVSLDGQTFSDCQFQNSRLVYAGGEPPAFVRCHFDACDWKFDDSAARTLAHLKILWASGAKASVQNIIKEITGAGR